MPGSAWARPLGQRRAQGSRYESRGVPGVREAAGYSPSHQTHEAALDALGVRHTGQQTSDLFGGRPTAAYHLNKSQAIFVTIQSGTPMAIEGTVAVVPLQDLILHEAGQEVIQQCKEDGYFNATAMCRPFGKLFADYRRNSSTDAYLEALSSDTGFSITELIQSLRGGDPSLQGTWVHSDVTLHLAQWLSPEFYVKTNRWVRKWTMGHEVSATERGALVIRISERGS